MKATKKTQNHYYSELNIDLFNYQILFKEVAKQNSSQLSFIDLFAGIGGFHIALHNLGCECVFASENDKFARMTYEHNLKKIAPNIFKKNYFAGDIQKVKDAEIPDFDILCAGFPCQPFSQIGFKNGFAETKENRGNMFFEIARILKAKKPKAYFLENVRNLENHDEGKTFKIIKKTIEDLGYSFYYKIVKASDYGLPQHRPRIFMVGFRNEVAGNCNFKFPEKTKLKYNMSNIFNGSCNKEIGFTLRVGGRGSKINDRRNWEFYMVNNQIKRIGLKEAKLMQGFPDDFNFPVSEIQAMKQLGNSVAISAVEAVANNIVNYIKLNDSLATRNQDYLTQKNSFNYD